MLNDDDDDDVDHDDDGFDELIRADHGSSKSI